MSIKPHCFEIDGAEYEWIDNMYYKKVAEKGQGEGFGQDALVHNAGRNASIKSDSNELHLATLNADAFRSSLQKIEMKKINQKIEFLQNIPCFV